MDSQISCNHCQTVNAISNGGYFDGSCGSCDQYVYGISEDAGVQALGDPSKGIEPRGDTAGHNHTPTDSLVFLNREAVGLLEAADEEIHGVSLDWMNETEDLPEHVQVAVYMVQTAIKLIRMESGFHGAVNQSHYSTGSPTSEVRQEPGYEPQGDGTTRIFMREMHYGLYPDGHYNHPAFRNEENTK